MQHHIYEMYMYIECLFYINVKKTEYHSKFLTYYISFSFIMILHIFFFHYDSLHYGMYA